MYCMITLFCPWIYHTNKKPRKIYGSRTVVNHVSFNVKQGEIVGLLGPNGAEKHFF